MVRKKKSQKKLLDPLEAIKRLLILDLYIKDVSTREIGPLLNISYKTIERLIPTRLKHEKRTKDKKVKKRDTSTSK